MNAFCSLSAGVLLVPGSGGSEPLVQHLLDRTPWSEPEELHMLSVIDDWEPVQGHDADSLAASCTSACWTRQAQLLAQALLDGISDELRKEVLAHLEELFASRVQWGAVLKELLVAPLRRPDAASALARAALANGWAATASLFDRLFDLQPLVHRFADSWLDLPPSMFTDLARSPSECWVGLARTDRFARLLEANRRRDFTAEWNLLAFEQETPPGRVAIAGIGERLAEAIFPCATTASDESDTEYDDTARDEDPYTAFGKSRASGRDALNRALKQINAIAYQVAEGKDRNARRFLDDLIHDQLQHSATQHALKSLCNIAQRCADMFRSDFERIALEEAMRLSPGDRWTLIQWGNHLKRTGAYDEAIAHLERALGSADDRVCLSSIADVWCERGQYDKAVDAYKRVPNWRDYVEVHTGFADVLRKQGKFGEAEAEYNRILDLWPEQAHRALAGKAEIAKRQGRLDEAIRAYESLLDRADVIEDRDRLIYRMAKCNVLKQKNRLQEAYQLADEIVNEAPFLMAARVSRASILGLLGEEEKGLRDIRGLCSGSTTAYEPATLAEWFLQYFRGLLLLKADRYQDAKRQLVSEFKSVVLTGDDLAIMRLGAAFAFLSKDNISEAASVLANVGDIQDSFTRYIRYVLQLHVAVAQSDTKRVESISRELQAACVEDQTLESAVVALSRADFVAAREYELELLLRIAA